MASITSSSQSNSNVHYLRVTLQKAFKGLPFPLTDDQVRDVKNMQERGRCDIALRLHPPSLLLMNQNREIVTLSVSDDPTLASLQTAALNRMGQLVSKVGGAWE